jgi:hypothetical protein
LSGAGASPQGDAGGRAADRGGLTLLTGMLVFAALGYDPWRGHGLLHHAADR